MSYLEIFVLTILKGLMSLQVLDFCVVVTVRNGLRIEMLSLDIHKGLFRNVQNTFFNMPQGLGRNLALALSRHVGIRNFK